MKAVQLGHPIGSGLVIAQIAWGLGRHAFYLTNHEFREFQKFSYGEWLQVDSPTPCSQIDPLTPKCRHLPL